jgi:hypothetical protein
MVRNRPESIGYLSRGSHLTQPGREEQPMFGERAPIPVAETGFPAPDSNSKSASSKSASRQLSGPRTLLSAHARQFDRNVPRGAHDPRASVRVGAANDRFQNKNELFRKHGRRLADEPLLWFRLGWRALNSITYQRAACSAQPHGRSAAPGQGEADGQRNRLDRPHRRHILRK